MNKKILIASIAGVVVVGLGVAAAALLFLGSDTRYETQAALLKAVPGTAKAELAKRGQPLAAPLVCESMPGASKERLMVSCAGTTSAKQPVRVFGASMIEKGREYYTILVAGKPLVKNVPCLGADCEDG